MDLPRLTPCRPLRIVRACVLAAWLCAAAGLPAAAVWAEAAGKVGNGTPPRENADYSEDEVKAAFLFHFATYAEWPPRSEAGDPQGDISFAMLDAPSIARALVRFSEGRTIKGRTVRVRRIRSLAQLDDDEVLFIGASQNRRLGQLIADVEGPTLVVSDSEDGLPEGAMINFQLVDRRVRFEIALPAAQRVGLSLSSRLLSAAMRVEMSRCYLECRVRGGDDRFAHGTAALRTSSRA